jgi:diguanylate cyclase (GGDEF)-like protein
LPTRSPRFRDALAFAGLTAVYFAAGQLGLTLGFEHSGTAAVWPATGIALAALLLLGRRFWPAVFLGAFLLGITTAGHLGSSLGVATGNALEAWVGAWLVERFAGGRHALERPRNILFFTLFAAVLSTMISATIFSVSLALEGAVPWTAFGRGWVTWWLGDASADMVVAPLILLWAGNLKVRADPRHLVEVAALLAAAVLASLLSFGGLIPGARTMPLSFLCTPVFIWGAFRCAPRTSALVVAIVYGVAVWGTLHGLGSFAVPSTNASLLLLQAFIGVSSLSTLMLGGLVSAARHNEDQLRQLAVSDALTGLANYRRLVEVIEHEIQRLDRTARAFAIVFLDVNGLKAINDAHGHTTGNRALCRVADALRQACRSIDTAARYGGDEFAIVLPESNEAAAAQLAKRISELLAAGGELPRIAVSTGMAICPRDGVTVVDLLATADRAQYETKRVSQGDAAGNKRGRRQPPPAAPRPASLFD